MKTCQCYFLFIFLPLLCSCQKYYLSVKREHINQSSLASTFVESPDPRKEHPPHGQELILQWRLPPKALNEELTLLLKIVYRDYTEESRVYLVERRRGVVTFSLLDEKFLEKKGFLTYKAEIKNSDGTVLKEWQQKLWFDLIDIED